jgi:hypothetical protein
LKGGITPTEPFRTSKLRGGVRAHAKNRPRPPSARIGWRTRRELLFRYLRYWIEAGHEKAGEPLSAEQVHALDALDRVLGRPDLRVEFALQPGQMFFINNRWILHNRTAFEDHAEPDRRRHYVRLWLRARDGH